jgi:hypothetical protein
MVTLPAAVEVTVMEHLPEERVQLADPGRVTLPVPDWVKVTVPVGEDVLPTIDTVTAQADV